ncbi:MAG: hypothetical protein AVDCRST_MAG75-1684, partial [uncultured Propionibacteriaceae bacterium]
EERHNSPCVPAGMQPSQLELSRPAELRGPDPQSDQHRRDSERSGQHQRARSQAL